MRIQKAITIFIMFFILFAAVTALLIEREKTSDMMKKIQTEYVEIEKTIHEQSQKIDKLQNYIESVLNSTVEKQWTEDTEPENKLDEADISQPVSRSEIQRGTIHMVTATAYTLRYQECGKKPDHPGYGITSSGKRARVNHTIAADTNWLPYGTKVYIPHFDRIFTVEDTGSAITGKRIDIFFGDPVEDPECVQRALDFGIRNLEIIILDEEG